MPSIDSIAIRRFKRLEDVKLDLTGTNVIVGANNSGKSSILQAIHFSVSIAQSAKLAGGVAWQKDSYVLSFSPAQLLYSPVADVMTLASGGMLTEDRNSRIEIEFLDSAGHSCVVALRRGRNRNIAIAIEGRELGERLQDIDHPFSIYAPGLAGIPREETYLSPGVVRRVVARGDANLVLRNVLNTLSKDQDKWSRFIEDMRAIFPGIELQVLFDEQTDQYIQALFQLPGGPELPIDAAGTSVLQASQILAYVSLFEPALLILDEPDSHLHPNNQRILCDLIYRLAAERSFQALVSTHSRHVLDAMRHRAHLVWLNKGALIDNPDDATTTILLDLGALDSADYFADTQVKCVVATEDTDTQPLEMLLWSSGFAEEDTKVVSYSGCSKADAAVVLGSFLRDQAANVKTVIHRDGDYLPPERIQEYKDRLTNAGIAPYLTPLNDVESSYLNPDHLAALNPQLSLARAEELIQQATNGTREASIKAIINLRTQYAFDARRGGGPAPDHGAIGLGAAQDYDANPSLMRRGKVVLPALRALLHQEWNASPRIFATSDFLAPQELVDLAAAIWPPG